MGLLTRRRTPESMKRLYDWFYAYYGSIERTLGPVLDEVVMQNIAGINNVSSKSALEYACGSGLFTLKIAPYFKSIDARDASEGMLSRAKLRAKSAGLDVSFSEGNILAVDEPDKSFDWVFVSFALHLFSPDDEVKILSRLLSVAREGVLIADHGKKWSLPVALVEWLEGSWYDRFIKTDFSAVAERIGARSFEENAAGDCSVMIFRP